MLRMLPRKQWVCMNDKFPAKKEEHDDKDKLHACAAMKRYN